MGTGVEDYSCRLHSVGARRAGPSAGVSASIAFTACLVETVTLGTVAEILMVVEFTQIDVSAKACHLLRAVLMTAVEEDKLISRNPCRIKGADNEQTPERPTLIVARSSSRPTEWRTGKRAFLHGGNFRREAKWAEALKEMGIKGLHFLQHTENTLAAQSGASLADLKARTGHDSDRAALINQHAMRDADQKIADVLSARVEAERKAGNI